MKDIKVFYNSKKEYLGKIYLGDCLDIIPTIKDDIEIAVTSPPYNLLPGLSKHEISRRPNWYNDSLPEPLYQANQKMVIELLLRLCDSSIFYNHKVRYAWHSRNKYSGKSKIYHPMEWLCNFPIWTEIIWDRVCTNKPISKRLTIMEERIYQIGKPNKFNEQYNIGNIWKIKRTLNQNHPCSFPLALPIQCILLCTDPGDTIIDPYLGSGQTAIAAIKNNRKFVGIEKNPKFFEESCRQINKYLSTYQQCKLDLFGGQA
mgnify:FL=1